MNPLISMIKFFSYIFSGALKFRGDHKGEPITMEDGSVFTIFRHAEMSGLPSDDAALFIVRFRLANMSPSVNKIFSLLPIPFFTGLRGFRKKFWMMNEKTGYFQGVYEWSTFEDADNYSRSFAMNFMKGRSAPGSTEFRILRSKSLGAYYSELTGRPY